MTDANTVRTIIPDASGNQNSRFALGETPEVVPTKPTGFVVTPKSDNTMDWVLDQTQEPHDSVDIEHWDGDDWNDQQVVYSPGTVSGNRAWTFTETNGQAGFRARRVNSIGSSDPSDEQWVIPIEDPDAPTAAVITIQVNGTDNGFVIDMTTDPTGHTSLILETNPDPGNPGGWSTVAGVDGTEDFPVNTATTFGEGDSLAARVTATNASGSTQSNVPQATIPVEGGGGDFILASNRTAVARFPLNLVNPRSSAGSASRYLWAHSGMDYQVPVCVSGGRPPFSFTLLAAPSGMTIANKAPSWNPNCHSWGEINWPAASVNASSGGQTVTIQVEDQNQNTDQVTITVTKDDTKFLFLAPGGSDGAAGTIGAPKQTIGSVLSQSGKIIVFRAGTYAASQSGSTDHGYRLTGSSTAKGWIGFPGEAVNLDMDTTESQSIFFSTFGFVHDLFFGNLKFTNPTQGTNKFVGVWRPTVGDRLVAWKISADWQNRTGPGSANNAVVTTELANRPSVNMSLVDWPDIRGIAFMGNSSAFNVRHNTDSSIDGVTSFASNCAENFYVKSSNTRLSVTNCSYWDPSSGAQPGLGIESQNAQSGITDLLVQYRYCRIRKTSGTGRALRLGDSNDPSFTHFADRCTFRHGSTIILLNGGTQAGTISKCAVVSDASPRLEVDGELTLDGNLEFSIAGDPLDSEGRFSDGNRGLVGFEVFEP